MKLVVHCTCPDEDVARHIAAMLVKQRLAACVNLLPQVMSVYRWQDKIEQGQEVLMLIKSDTAHFEMLKETILDMHPYELPEIIGVPIHEGHPEYLAWIKNNLSDP